MLRVARDRCYALPFGRVGASCMFPVARGCKSIPNVFPTSKIQRAEGVPRRKERIYISAQESYKTGSLTCQEEPITLFLFKLKYHQTRLSSSSCPLRRLPLVSRHLRLRCPILIILPIKLLEPILRLLRRHKLPQQLQRHPHHLAL